MKYDAATTLGLRWAAVIDVRTAYDWEPTTYLPGVAERSVLGVGAPLWSETVVTRQDFEFLAFPRLARGRRAGVVDAGGARVGRLSARGSGRTGRGCRRSA
jgi:N-acetyl-beta-hexosaminidase